jgi:hypothetical protein
MTIRTFTTALILIGALSRPSLAQNPTTNTQTTPRAQTTPRPPTPPAPAAEPEPPAPPRRVGQPVNIKIDVTITDQGRPGMPPVKKTVSVVTADGLNGRIRSSAVYAAIGNVPLNVDAEPELIADGKIRLRVNLQYSLPADSGGQGQVSTSTLRSTEIVELLSVIVESGKPIVAAQSADPVGDRQVIIELKATVLK